MERLWANAKPKNNLLSESETSWERSKAYQSYRSPFGKLELPARRRDATEHNECGRRHGSLKRQAGVRLVFNNAFPSEFVLAL